MAPRHTQAVSDGLPQYASFYRRRIGLQRYAEQLCIGDFVRTKGNDSSDTCRLRRGNQSLILAIVAIENSGAAFLDARENFRFGVGNLSERAEVFEVDRFDGCND